MGGFAKKYTDPQREAAVKLYLATGSEEQTAKALGIPRETVKTWRQSQWWRDFTREYLAERDFQIQQTFTSIIEDAAGVVADRIKHGDAYIAKDGTERRKPISVKDAGLIVAIFHDKRRDARNQDVQITNLQTTQQILNEIADKMAELGGQKEPKPITPSVPESVTIN